MRDMHEQEVNEAIGQMFAPGSEPTHRDFAKTSIERGVKSLRRDRTFAAGGIALSAAAVVAVSMTVAGTGGGAAQRNTAGAGAPAHTEPVGATAKRQEINAELPGLLNSMLPSGYSVSKGSVTLGPLLDGLLLTGQTGTSQITVTVAHAPSAAEASGADPSPTGCDSFPHPSGEPRTEVADGTVYVAKNQSTFKQSNRDPADSFLPGTMDRVQTEGVCYTFVPSDSSRQPLSMSVQTHVAKYEFAAKAPADWKGGAFPPSYDQGVPYDPSGPSLSEQQFIALLADPHVADLKNLLDTNVAPSAEYVAKQKQIDDQIAQLTKSVLPAGYSLSVADQVPAPMLLLTGPTGENMAGWRYNADAPKLSCDTGAPAGSGPSACTLTHVSGGTLLRQAGSTPASPDQQQLIFRAANGNEFSLSYQPSHNGPSGTGMTDDAFVAMATNPAIGGVVAEVDGLIVKSS